MNLKKKLVIAFLVFTVINILISVNNHIFREEVIGNLNRISNKLMPRVMLLNDIESHCMRMMESVISGILIIEKSQDDAVLSEWLDEQRSSDISLFYMDFAPEALNEDIDESDEDEASAREMLIEEIAEYQEIAGELDTLLALYRSNAENETQVLHITGINLHIDSLRNTISRKINPQIFHLTGDEVLAIKEEIEEIEEDILESINNAINYENRLLTQGEIRANQSTETAFLMNWLTILIGAVLSVLLGYFFATSISKPINKLTEAFSDVGNGNLNAKVSIDSQDEFGMLASSFNAMVNDLREARDNAEIAIKAKTDFLATMSHEIRTPMNGVIGMTSLLSETPLDCEQKECVETIRVSGETLLSIINDILDFSKIDSGKLRLEEHDFNLKGMVDEVIDLLAPSIKNKNLDLLNIIESDVPAILRGDATRLRQVLFNLVGNAIKFTAEGEILISISRVEIDNNIATLEFSIKDTGIGITDSQITKIFDAFAQADSSINRRFGGSGLGLAICSKLVQLMGGNIGVKSTPGIGSVFTFSVQMTVVSQHQPEDIHIPDVIKGKQVLIVDDNQTNCRILAMQCNKWQLVPHIASDNTAAMAIVESGQHFDIILMDYQMPDVDGVTLTEQIWQYSKRSIPTILLSSLDISSEISRFLDNANTEFVQKPIKMDRLYTALKLMLSRKKSIIRKKSIQPVTLDTHLFEKYPLKILVAEDNQINQKLILRILSKMGYNADLVSNGLEVLEAIQRQQYDLVLMDVQMPEMDGIEATRQIRNDTAFDSLRIVALTANALEGDREKCLNAGMNDYLSKPFKFDEFQHKIVMQSESDGSQVT